MDKELRDKLERKMQSGNSIPVRDVRLGADELRALLDIADERDELEKAVDPRGRRPPGTSIVQLAEWKTYLAGVRDRILTLVMRHCRDEDSDADDTVDRLVIERDRYRDTLFDLREYFDNYVDVTDSPRGIAEMPNEEMEWKQAIDAALEGKTNG